MRNRVIVIPAQAGIRKMGKSDFSVVSLSDQSDDKDFWFAMDPIERMRHIEVLRRIDYGHGATSRLQRVLEYTEG